MPDPLPKRSDQRRRRNKGDGPDLVKAPGGAAPVMSSADEDWRPIAARWYASLTESGQAQFCEASDWATAYYVAEAMSRNLAPEADAEELHLRPTSLGDPYRK